MKADITVFYKDMQLGRLARTPKVNEYYSPNKGKDWFIVRKVLHIVIEKKQEISVIVDKVDEPAL